MEGLGWSSAKNQPICVSTIGSYAEVNVPADVFWISWGHNSKSLEDWKDELPTLCQTIVPQMIRSASSWSHKEPQAIGTPLL